MATLTVLGQECLQQAVCYAPEVRAVFIMLSKVFRNTVVRLLQVGVSHMQPAEHELL